MGRDETILLFEELRRHRFIEFKAPLSKIIFDRFGELLVFPSQESRLDLKHCDFTSEIEEHRSEFKADIAPADDEKMMRERLSFKKSLTHVNILGMDAGDRRNERPSAGIDDDCLAFVSDAIGNNVMGIDEGCLAIDDFDERVISEFVVVLIPEFPGQSPFLFNGGLITGIPLVVISAELCA